MYRRGAAVYRRITCRTNIEFCELVIRNLDRISWVSISSCNTLSSLRREDVSEQSAITETIRTCATILGSGLRSSNRLANLAAVAWLLAFTNTPIALRSAIWRWGGCNLQWVKYAASSRFLRILSGASCWTRRRSSSIETPRRYSLAIATSSRHLENKWRSEYVRGNHVLAHLFRLRIRGNWNKKKGV